MVDSRLQPPLIHSLIHSSYFPIYLPSFTLFNPFCCYTLLTSISFIHPLSFFFLLCISHLPALLTHFVTIHIHSLFPLNSSPLIYSFIQRFLTHTLIPPTFLDPFTLTQRCYTPSDTHTETHTVTYTYTGSQWVMPSPAHTISHAVTESLWKLDALPPYHQGRQTRADVPSRDRCAWLWWAHNRGGGSCSIRRAAQRGVSAASAKVNIHRLSRETRGGRKQRSGRWRSGKVVQRRVRKRNMEEEKRNRRFFWRGKDWEKLVDFETV